MSSIIKFFWRLIMSIFLYRKNVKVYPTTRFNQKTVFEGNNVIGKGSVVGNSYIGRNTYIGNSSHLSNCRIGRFCSIASDIKVVAETHPSSVFVSTSPSFFSTGKQNRQSFVKTNKFNEHLRVDGYNLIIGNDVWIGSHVLFKGGINVGDGAIVAMGSVVTKDIPPYAIVGGVPARIIKYRFTEEQIAQLQAMEWWNKPDEWLKAHVEEFENIDCFLKKD